MSVPIKAVQRGEPGIVGGGTKRYYAVPHYRGIISLTELAQEISRMSSLSRPDVAAVLQALLVILPGHLSQGRVISLGDFGTFRVTLRSGAGDTAREVDGNNVRLARLRFMPGKELRDLLGSLSVEKVEG